VLPTSPLSRAFSSLHALATFALGSANIVDVLASPPGGGGGGGGGLAASYQA